MAATTFFAQAAANRRNSFFLAAFVVAILGLLGFTVGYAIVGWPAFWWLEHFPEFDKHLRSRYRCEVENDRVIAFDLRGT